jgi:hypothetical protein
MHRKERNASMAEAKAIITKVLAVCLDLQCVAGTMYNWRSAAVTAYLDIRRASEMQGSDYLGTCTR